MKSFRNTAAVQLFNFQDPRKKSIKKSDFYNNYIKTESLTLPENVADDHNMCQQFSNISSLTDKLVLP